MADITSNHTIECPYCGAEHGDLWEWNINEFESYGEYECCECGKTFMLERHYDVWYTADKKEEEHNLNGKTRVQTINGIAYDVSETPDALDIIADAESKRYICDECGESCELRFGEPITYRDDAWGRPFTETVVPAVSACCGAGYEEAR